MYVTGLDWPDEIRILRIAVFSLVVAIMKQLKIASEGTVTPLHIPHS